MLRGRYQNKDYYFNKLLDVPVEPGSKLTKKVRYSMQELDAMGVGDRTALVLKNETCETCPAKQRCDGYKRDTINCHRTIHRWLEDRKPLEKLTGEGFKKFKESLTVDEFAELFILEDDERCKICPAKISGDICYQYSRPLENYSGCDGIIVAYFRFIETGEML